ncbi:outer membrane protein assembly factor BamB [Marinobacter sp.]|jgi:outer membrane protein assembly factor BamB|uniref:outer membrane protein assembly factor BamB n=1 Tax=Marinobacter sp. TaxID=50741 RepID=UPI000C370DEA|nr:outer membrane protein assembly factor BamB [Marinobacter sp.]MBE97305.1 outer membrane protein assembly factor BamB [Marinobacter sp.]MBP54637.1 outer membrane protein assembly factor BamB [Marinobacter sp.]
MPWLVSGHTRLRSLAGILTLAVLAGCSTSDTFEQPAPVPEISSSVGLESVWTMDVGDGHDDKFLYLAPLNTGDRLYAASADGEVYAVGSENGEVFWSRDLDEQISAGVGGDQGNLYVVSRDAELMALSREDGSALWEQPLPNEVLASPQSNGRLVVAQTIDGKVLAFDAATGEQAWQYDSDVPVLSIRAAASPLVGADLVLAALANGKLMAISTETGQPIWQYEVGQPQGRTELERLVDVAGEPLILESAAMIVGYQGKLALIDLQTGQEIWSRPASSLQSPMIGNGNIFVAGANGDITAYRGSDRRELWVQDRLSWRQPTQPVVFEDYLLIGDFEGYIHMLSLEDGSLVGQLEFDDEGLRVPFQRLQNGNLLVYGNSGKLSVLKLRTLD